MKLTRSNVFSALLVAAAMVGCGGAVNPGNDGATSCPANAPPLGSGTSCANWPAQCIYGCQTCTCFADGQAVCEYTCGGPDGDAGPDVHVDAGGPPPCPTAPPANGSACSQSDQQCSYGDDPSARCRRLATCSGGTHQWDVQDPEGCMVDAGNPTCPATAPASLSACTASSQLCGYGDGTRCTCANCPPGGPACMIGPLEWYCGAPPPASCPALMPNLGTPCTSTAAQCDYGACIGNGWAVACTDGVWVRQNIACAE